MNTEVLYKTAQAMVAPRRGILAMDESHPTCRKRFEKLGIAMNKENRCAYRSMLVTTRDLGSYISAAILFDETIRQTTLDGNPFAEQLAAAGIIPGIKVDKGAKPLAGFPNEKITEGLDGLRERLEEYRALGARFAKWRAVITIGKIIPSGACISANAHALARYASLCQEAGLVPIVEPEVLMDGAHTIDQCYQATVAAQTCVFNELRRQKVDLRGIVLKPNMVVSGNECPHKASTEEIAKLTLHCLLDVVPAVVPGIAFLSGGMSDEDATANLNTINLLARQHRGQSPWRITFSYGRALQHHAMKTWGGSAANVSVAQAAVLRRAKMNGAASDGAYTATAE